MNKNTFLNNKVVSKSNIAIFLAILSVYGFLFSRPVNSLATTLFGLNALWGINPKHWLKQKWWWFCVLWVATYAITYFWTDNLKVWHWSIDVKLPFLLLPLSYALLPKFSTKQLLVLTVGVALLLLAGAGYSCYHYFKDAAYYIKEYQYSGVLPTPVENDHICFSLFIAVFIAWCVYFFPYIDKLIWKVFIVLTAVLLSAFLHLLSAKSGLLALYLFIICWTTYMVVKKNPILGLSIIALMVGFVFFAWNYIPTFKQRLGYVHYTYEMYREGNRTGDYSDMGRVISYDIAIRLIEQHPWAGIGSGDILQEMKKGYDQWYPGVKTEQQLYPHNQFLTVALGCGIPAAIVLFVLVLYPMLQIRKGRRGFFTFTIAFILLVPLMVEPFLEIQFGVFVYLFFLLWTWCIHFEPARNEQRSI